MSLKGRFRFLIGIAVVVGLVLALFVYLNYSMSRVTSLSAHLDTDSYSVGADYSGIIDQQYVQLGDTVKPGDKLFKLRSPTLAQDLANNYVQRNDLLFTLDTDGSILITATKHGVVSKIEYTPGSFVPANSEIARVALDNTLFVTATYHLASPDYARINRDSNIVVTLPDNRQLTAKVYDISLEQNQNLVETVVKARLNQQDTQGVVFTPGTPVQTLWQLDNNTWYNSIVTSVESLFQPKSGVK